MWLYNLKNKKPQHHFRSREQIIPRLGHLSEQSHILPQTRLISFMSSVWSNLSHIVTSSVVFCELHAYSPKHMFHVN